MEFDRVRRHPRLAVIEIEERDPGYADARAEAHVGASRSHLLTA